MNNVEILPKENIGKNFIPPEYLPAGKDEYYVRDKQSGLPQNHWRHLHPDEIKALVQNNNWAGDWDTVFVSNDFNPDLIRNSEFFGLVRIGALRDVILEHLQQEPAWRPVLPHLQCQPRLQKPRRRVPRLLFTL